MCETGKNPRLKTQDQDQDQDQIKTFLFQQNFQKKNFLSINFSTICLEKNQ